jgi:hypothetical protein
MTTGTLGYDFNDKIPNRFEAAGTHCDSLAPDAQWRPKNAGFETFRALQSQEFGIARIMI